MQIDEDLIQNALLKSKPGDLDNVLTAIEAYRICAQTARKLDAEEPLGDLRVQAAACAEYCESVLADYAATGLFRKSRYPETGCHCARLTLEMRW